jgi:monothiol glutaredoxin
LVERLNGIQKVSGSIPLSSTITKFKSQLERMTQENILDTIGQIIKDNNVVLFMKGTKNFPQCGFSGTVCGILENLNIDFKDINVLEDQQIRQGIKEFSDWPTIPQLYVKGQFIGGCDIVRELNSSGELQKLLV